MLTLALTGISPCVLPVPPVIFFAGAGSQAYDITFG
jgi:cytochrome c biogenesis protein CcdA